MGRKLGAVPLWGRDSWVPILHNVARDEAYLHAKFHLDPIHPTVWPQCTNVTDRQDRQTDRQTRQTVRQDRQRLDSIGRTVLQTVAQNIA